MSAPRPPLPGPPRPVPPSHRPGPSPYRPTPGPGAVGPSVAAGDAGATDTGHPAVDAVLRSLANTAPLSPTDQIAEYEAAHRVLQETLASIDRA